MMMRHGLTAIVTGGGRGIGRAVALALAREGVGVCVTYRTREADARETVREMEAVMPAAMEREPAPLLALPCDVSDVETQEERVQEVLQEVRSVTLGNAAPQILVNCAGAVQDALTVRMEANAFRECLQTNLVGTFLWSKAVLAEMLRDRTRGGRIVNVASVVGQIGQAGQSNYAAAKAGVLGLTRSMAKEVASRGITVNAVSPGYIDTELLQGLDTDTLIKDIPVGRLGHADEVAGLVRFLALDPAAAYMTGHVHYIDGGLAIGAT